MAGTLAAVVKVWIAFSRYFSHSGDPWIAIILAVLGAVLAMVGPGAWSIDARLFGRKRIDFPERLVKLFSPPIVVVPMQHHLANRTGRPSGVGRKQERVHN